MSISRVGMGLVAGLAAFGLLSGVPPVGAVGDVASIGGIESPTESRAAARMTASGADRAVVASWPRMRVKGLRVAIRGHKARSAKWAKWGQAKQLRPKATRHAFKGLRNGREYQVKLDIRRGSKWRTFASGVAVANAPRFTPGPISMVSTASAGAPGNESSQAVSVSRDGTKLAFSSYATNLVPADTNDQEDVFTKDLTTGVTTRVSTATNGAQGNKRSYGATISADGSKVVFTSEASNLVAGDANNAIDVFVKDLSSGSVRRVSVTQSGGEGNSGSYGPVLSADGTKVAFTSKASNLVPNDGDTQSDIFVKNLDTGALDWGSDPYGGCSYSPAMSPDGTKLAYVEIISGNDGPRSGIKILLRSLTTGQVTQLTAHGDDPLTLAFAPDGARVAYSNWQNVSVIDLTTGAITIVSRAANGTPSNDDDWDPVFSADGSRIAFTSAATNLVPGYAGNSLQVYVKDLQTGGVQLVSTNASGRLGAGSSRRPVFMPGTNMIAFESDATLTPGGGEDVSQIFIKTIQ